jgi:hypothetical protein
MRYFFPYSTCLGKKSFNLVTSVRIEKFGKTNVDLIINLLGVELRFRKFPMLDTYQTLRIWRKEIVDFLREGGKIIKRISSLADFFDSFGLIL